MFRETFRFPPPYPQTRNSKKMVADFRAAATGGFGNPHRYSFPGDGRPGSGRMIQQEM